VRQTKIVATIGPASSDRAIVESLVAAGVNVFRLNFSHGSQEIHRATLETIRAVAAEAGRPVGILQESVRPEDPDGRARRGPGDRVGSGRCARDSDRNRSLESRG
jgi:pyruvate kinase